jgi:hypothetical protein
MSAISGEGYRRSAEAKAAGIAHEQLVKELFQQRFSDSAAVGLGDQHLAGL